MGNNNALYYSTTYSFYLYYVRWLRALLCEGPDEEVVALDVFGPAAFGLVLDYMYGSQLGISMEVGIAYQRCPTVSFNV